MVGTAASGRVGRLTGREREIVAAVARGASDSEIAERFFIGTATVKSRVPSILAELGLRERIQIVIFAYESGLVEAGDHDVGHGEGRGGLRARPSSAPEEDVQPCRLAGQVVAFGEVGGLAGRLGVEP